MFSINYRIIDNDGDLLKYKFTDKEEPIIEGFIELNFGNFSEGSYYHESPLKDGERGCELLDCWICNLVEVTNNLSLKGYAAFCEIDRDNRWLEFKLVGNSITINVAIDGAIKRLGYYETFKSEVYEDFEYIDRLSFSIEFKKFRNEILNTARGFIDEIGELNRDLLKAQAIVDLENKLSQISY